MGSKSFKVIIVGGSVAGLTLAHCLEHARINYVVLERNINIAPQLGSTIVLMPNGSRILDQLGILEEIEHYIEPLNGHHFCHSDGSGFISDYLTVLTKRQACKRHFKYKTWLTASKLDLDIQSAASIDELC
jgi:FAD dependent monooxygenase